MRTIHIHSQFNNHIPLKLTNPAKLLPIPASRFRRRLRSVFHGRPIPTDQNTRDLALDGRGHTLPHATEHIIDHGRFIVAAGEGVRVAGDGPGACGRDVCEEGLSVVGFEGGEDPLDSFAGEHWG